MEDDFEGSVMGTNLIALNIKGVYVPGNFPS